MTVAYVFWHRPRADADAGAYLEALARFHEALLAEPPRGLLASWSARVGTPPWPDGGEGWLEDWYVLRGLGALGALERAAIDARRRGAHDAAAAGTGEGTAGIYGLVGGEPVPGGGLAAATWLGKPDGEPYERFIPALREQAGPDAAVWQRRLTLGPTPEFAVLGPRSLESPWPQQVTSLEPVVAPTGPATTVGPPLRDATVEDAPILTELAVRSKGHWGYDAGFLQRARRELTVTAEDIQQHIVHVAVGDEGPLGFSAVDVHSAPAELLALWVEPSAIGTGVGRALLRDALATAATHGTGGLLVESDPNAESFYLHHGARRLGERRSPSTKRLLPLLWLPA
jgi:GNAT superfamily N-acetyltransferase